MSLLKLILKRIYTLGVVAITYILLVIALVGITVYHTILGVLGVEALINILLVIALVSITAYYAHQTSKQTEIMRGEGKRRYIVELMKFIIAPLIHTIEQEIELLEKREYGWLHISLSAYNISKLVVSPEILFNDLKRDFPDLGGKIKDHDNRVSTLQEKLKSLDQAICTPDFERECLTLIEEHNDKVKKSGGDPGYLLESSSRSVGYIVESIINNNLEHTINNARGRPQNREAHYFWRDYGEELLKIRDKVIDREKAKLGEIDFIVGGLKIISRELKRYLEKRRDSYRQEYHISIGEFDESLLPIDAEEFLSML